MDEVTLQIDPNELTMQDLIDLEDVSGTKISDFLMKMEAAVPGFTAKELTALVLICGRKADPNFKLADALATKIAKVQTGVVVNPTEGPATSA